MVGGRSAAVDVRESLRAIPCQGLVSLVTGKPHQGQRGFRMTPAFHVAGAAASICLGLGASALGLLVASASGGLLVLLGWAMTLHGMRNLRIMIFHHCAHGRMWGHRGLDRFTGSLISGLLVVPDLQAYSVEHVADHHSRHHMSMRDPTVRTLIVTLGLRAGMSPRAMWRRLVRQLASPRFHLRFALARVQACLGGATWRQRAAIVVSYGVLTLLLTRFDAWIWFLVGWVVPLTLPFQVANTLRLCARHTFPDPGDRSPARVHVANLTSAVFLGDAAPPRELAPAARLASWLAWWARMAFVHLPSRYLVITGDTVCHDYHHRHPNLGGWADYIFARQRDVESGHPGWPPYREVWGLVPAINLVFESLSAADPNLYDPALIPAAERRRLSTFDD